MVRYNRAMRAFVCSLVCSSALALLLAAGCGRGAETSDAEVLPPAQAAKMLIDRNWMDVWPESPDERLHVYRFVPSMGGGVYQDRTVFKGNFELFVFKTNGKKILFGLPETKQRVKTGFEIARVDGPKPFDLRLTLADSPRGPKVFYGRSAETANDNAVLGDAAADALAGVAADFELGELEPGDAD